MATEIRCEKMVIRKIFELWYRIPEYQRPYVWEQDQVKELLEDTMDAYKSNEEAQYFLGSMVLKINEKTDNDVTYNEYELLDGQQRLTTMFLIFASIRDVADQSKYAKIIENCKKAIFQEEDEFINQPERLRVVFDIRDDVRNFVNKYVKVDGGTNAVTELKALADDKTVNVSVRNMSNAIVNMRAFFEDNMDELPGYFKFFLTKVLMIYVATEELQDAFQLFTVLNNRGVKLSNSDILKAENLKEISSASARADWARKWEEMESYFGEDFDKFMSHIRTILVKRKAALNLLKEFEDNVYSNRVYNRTTKSYETRTPLLTRGRQTFEYIDDFYNIYIKLFDSFHPDGKDDFAAYNYLKLMSYGLGADYWVAPVMDYYKRYKTDRLLDFIKLVDKKISADWIISLSPTKRIENMNAILQEVEKSDSADRLLCSDVFGIDRADFERVLNGDIYGRRFARYLLMKLDLLYLGNTTSFNPPSTISIEHILPQNPSVGSKWMTDFTDNEREEWTDKLGNLALISRRKNTSQGNLDFEQKMSKYFEKNIEVFPNSIRIYKKYKIWTPEQLRENHSEVVKKILDEYK